MSVGCVEKKASECFLNRRALLLFVLPSSKKK